MFTDLPEEELRAYRSGVREPAAFDRFWADTLARARARARTRAYVDGVNFARRCRLPARFSVALMDEIVPPSTVFAAVNAYRGPTELSVWRYNGHEAGGADDAAAELRFLQARLAPGGTPGGAHPDRQEACPGQAGPVPVPPSGSAASPPPS
ncbi:acetylxylan esterase [Micromonospora deserti]|uniref:Acetyl xylan esterase domain-containing protein n=1 Tax=Micromonospora deserti TaxID=2070366 RepID=A0A2W2CE75_9ACTN|nr:acetylxylan esterase [Micromonospora deserti]PZF83956.1 hypothetical protein C1I99_30735 [Micromonospora deserti]